MKREPGGAPTAAVTIYRILLTVAALLVCALIVGTVFGLRSAGRDAKSTTSGTSGAPAAATDGPSYFTGIGRVRAATADAKPATVVVSVAFPFDRTDSAFSEELAAKTKNFRKIAADYFSGFSAVELRGTAEAVLKEELRGRFNGVLLLGKIEALYFNDYLLIE